MMFSTYLRILPDTSDDIDKAVSKEMAFFML